MDWIELFLQWSIFISFLTSSKTNENQYVQNFELDTRYSRLTYLNDGKSVPIDYIFRIKAGLYHLTRCHPQDVADGGIILKPDHPLADSSKIFEFSLEQVRILTMDLNLMAFRILIVEDHWLVNCGFTSDSMALIFYTSVSKSIAQQPTVVDYFSAGWPIKKVKRIAPCEEADWCSQTVGGYAKMYFEPYDKGFIYTLKEYREEIGLNLKPILVFSETRSMLSKHCTHEVVLHVLGYFYYILSFVDDKNAELFHRQWFERTKIPLAVPKYVEAFLEKSQNSTLTAE